MRKWLKKITTAILDTEGPNSVSQKNSVLKESPKWIAKRWLLFK